MTRPTGRPARAYFRIRPRRLHSLLLAVVFPANPTSRVSAGRTGTCPESHRLRRRGSGAVLSRRTTGLLLPLERGFDNYRTNFTSPSGYNFAEEDSIDREGNGAPRGVRVRSDGTARLDRPVRLIFSQGRESWITQPDPACSECDTGVPLGRTRPLVRPTRPLVPTDPRRRSPAREAPCRS